MVREEAIERLKRKIDCIENGALCSDFGSDKEVFDMAIEALEQEPVLDIIREEIEQASYEYDFEYGDYIGEDTRKKRIINTNMALEIIDKYRIY